MDDRIFLLFEEIMRVRFPRIRIGVEWQKLMKVFEHSGKNVLSYSLFA